MERKYLVMTEKWWHTASSGQVLSDDSGILVTSEHGSHYMRRCSRPWDDCAVICAWLGLVMESDQHLHPRFSEQRMPGEITSLKLLVWNLNHSAIIFSSRCVSVSIQPIIKGSSSAPILTEGLLSPSLSIWNNSVGSHQNQNIFRAPSNPHNLTTKQFRSDVIAEQGCHPYNEYWIDQHAREKGE